MKQHNISVFGLGKLGLCIAALFAEKGYKTYGVDVSKGLVESLNSGKVPIVEPGLSDSLTRGKQNISFGCSVQHAVTNSDISVLILPTPSVSSGNFATSFLQECCKDIALVLKGKQSYHLFIIVSTVTPGSCRSDLIPLIERYADKKCGIDFGFVYSPEFIALGTVMKNLRCPDIVLIGCDDSDSGNSAASLYEDVVDNSPVFHVVTIENAELAKLSLNCFITTKITFANYLSALCEKIPHTDIDSISAILGSDSRIGRKYLTGGLGYGGPCFPRDNKALTYVANGCDRPSDLLEVVDRVNDSIPERIISLINFSNGSHARVSVLGLSYKKGSPVFIQSQALSILQACGSDSRFSLVIGYDRYATSIKSTQHLCKLTDNLSDTQSSDVFVVCLELEPDELLFMKSLRNVQVVDLWRQAELSVTLDSSVKYTPVGNYINSVYG